MSAETKTALEKAIAEHIAAETEDAYVTDYLVGAVCVKYTDDGSPEVFYHCSQSITPSHVLYGLHRIMQGAISMPVYQGEDD